MAKFRQIWSHWFHISLENRIEEANFLLLSKNDEDAVLIFKSQPSLKHLDNPCLILAMLPILPYRPSVSKGSFKLAANMLQPETVTVRCSKNRTKIPIIHSNLAL